MIHFSTVKGNLYHLSKKVLTGGGQVVEFIRHSPVRVGEPVRFLVQGPDNLIYLKITDRVADVSDVG